MSAPAAATGPARGWGWWPGWALLAWWTPFLWRVSPAWSGSIEQAYGWAVPLLAAYLAVERAGWAPDPAQPGAVARRAAWGVTVAGMLALPLGLTVLEANPLWPLAQWAAFGAVAGVTFAALTLLGGGAWARHFWFPVLFVATALTWPAVITTRLVNHLVAMNAQLAATAVSLAGHPAVVKGNIIEISAGFVGIDEACSGLRSLQAVWMAGWFFGELLRLDAARRLALVGGALGIAVVGNWMRTTALTWLAAAHGPAAGARWHDRAGEFELAGTLLAVAVAAWWFGRRRAPPAVLVAGRLLPTGGRLVSGCLLAGGLSAALVPVVWYGAHEATAGTSRVQWALRRPDAEWREITVPGPTRELLRPSAIEGWQREERTGSGWTQALVVRWEGDVARAARADWHDPTICLPSAGLAVTVAAEPVSVEVEGATLQFTEGQVSVEGRVQHVFYCHWDAWLARTRDRGATDLSDVDRWRLDRVRAGRRRGDAAFVIFVVPLAERGAAEAWLRAWAPQLLERR